MCWLQFYSSADGIEITPPDGWGTRATYRVAPETSREEIVDFYLSELSLDWASCVDTIGLVEQTGTKRTIMGNANFVKETALVSIDTMNLASEWRNNTFDVYVDHERSFDPPLLFRDTLIASNPYLILKTPREKGKRQAITYKQTKPGCASRQLSYSLSTRPGFDRPFGACGT